MKKAKSICSKCRKVKREDCDICKKKPFDGISTEHYDFYNSYGWRKFATGLRKHNPLCVKCLEEGRTAPSQVVDHIVSIDDGGDKWDLDNLQVLCHTCHNKKTAKNKRK